MASPEPDETLDANDAIVQPQVPRLPIHEVTLPVYQPVTARPRATRGWLLFMIVFLLSTFAALLIVGSLL